MSLPTTLLVDTLDTLDLAPSAPTIIIWARGPLTLMLMPTPLDRSTVDFPMPTLLPLAMPTTPDMLPTPPSPPTHTLHTPHTPDILVTTDLPDTPPTWVKQDSSKQPKC